MFASDLTEKRKAELCSTIAERVVRFRVTPLAIVFLETIKPISFLGNQLMVFFAPMVGAFISSPLYEEMTAFLEERSNLEMLIRTIEEAEAAKAAEQKKLKAQRKKKARSSKSDKTK